MAEEPTSVQATPPPRAHRRSSFAGQTFADLFGTSRSSKTRPSADGSNNSPPSQQYVGPISQAAAHAQQRRLSLTTLGLSGAANPTSPYASLRASRRDSTNSANSGSLDESAIEDDAAPRDPSSTPTTPFARRMSFGARALRDVRNSSGGGGGAGQNGTRSPPAAVSSTTAPAKAQTGTISSRDTKGRGLSLPVPFRLPIAIVLQSAQYADSVTSAGSADFWSENMRTRAERTSSIVGQPAPPPMHARAKSVAVMEPPVQQMPMAKEEQRRPDHFQERILKGDFYMD